MYYLQKYKQYYKDDESLNPPIWTTILADEPLTTDMVNIGDAERAAEVSGGKLCTKKNNNKKKTRRKNKKNKKNKKSLYIKNRRL